MSGDTHDDGGAPSSDRSITFAPSLTVLLECDRPLAGSARYSLEGVDVVTIGRGTERVATRQVRDGVPTLDLRIPGRSVSASHARLVRDGASWTLEDAGSKNGTRVNGVRVTNATLGPDDLCDLGHTFLRVDPSFAMPDGAAVDADISGPRPGEHASIIPTFAAHLARAARLAASSVPVIVLGESGTGKELLARWLHAQTGRSGPFVAVNCGALPDGLVESQLFGHQRGAFSGAVRDEPGFVRSADGGTLFLDEIADLPMVSQAALLRVLQEREVVPVGAARGVAVDVCLLAATHEDLAARVERGDFRRDLYARIAGSVVRLPALRERRDDLGVLVATLLSRVSGAAAADITFEPDVGRALLAYKWPHNVRELEQCLATCAALAEEGRVRRSHLPEGVARALDVPPGDKAQAFGDERVDDGELRTELLMHLHRHDGNIAEVARRMGKARMQIQRWCRRYGIDPRAYRDRSTRPG
jgi:transcriptional regulator with AAA-type ATPase domain